MIFGDKQREITYSDLSEMKYLDRVIKESMRLFPVARVLFRTITNDIQLREFAQYLYKKLYVEVVYVTGTCELPKGTTVTLGVFETQRNPSLWNDPLKFHPDRFLPEEIAKKHPYSYLPFSAGPRDCLGCVSPRGRFCWYKRL